MVVSAVCSRAVIPARVCARQQLLEGAQGELAAAATETRCTQHYIMFLLLSLGVHHRSLLCFFPSPLFSAASSLAFFLSGCSKLDRGPGFSALSESSVSDDTASSCTRLSEKVDGGGRSGVVECCHCDTGWRKNESWRKPGFYFLVFFL